MFRYSAVILLLLNALPGFAAEREQISIVGSPSVLHATETITRHFTANWNHPAPTLEITGAGAGFGRFCAGVGREHPDIKTASRRITEAELATCGKNGVSAITEIEFARDALVLVSNVDSESLDLTVSDLYSALAREVEVNGKIVSNATKRWQEIDPSLPANEIRFIGPSAHSALMFTFLEKVMAAGCPQSPAVKALGEERRYRLCRDVRGADAFREASRTNPAHVLNSLKREPAAIGVMQFTLYEANADTLTVHRINGVAPTTENISTGRYPLVQPVYLYVKNRHVGSIPGLQRLIYEFASERAISDDGYLTTGTGLVPLDDIGRNRARDNAISLQPLSSLQSE